MLAQVLIAEADCFVAMWKDLKLPDGRVVRHGHGPHRVRRAKVRDRGDVEIERRLTLKAPYKSGSFPPPTLLGFNGRTTLSDSRQSRRLSRR
jgi:hypothetical protein